MNNLQYRKRYRMVQKLNAAQGMINIQPVNSTGQYVATENEMLHLEVRPVWDTGDWWSQGGLGTPRKGCAGTLSE